MLVQTSEIIKQWLLKYHNGNAQIEGHDDHLGSYVCEKKLWPMLSAPEQGFVVIRDVLTYTATYCC